ncbi:MAG TPA: dihydrolipoyl dehydrogenase [Elusimicrobiota bacterium]|nr:dihydrolipoyl dehydrogenase [Elusimicrobiota bacterium]
MKKLSVVVLGAGPGGEAAAKKAAAHGAEVTVVEKADLGGLCLNRGCVPTKTLLEAGRLLNRARAASAYLKGSDGLRVEWDALQKKKTEVVSLFRKSIADAFARQKIKLLRGQARFLDDHTLVVHSDGVEDRLSFDRAIVATGSVPLVPPPFPAVEHDLLDSDKALGLARVPKRLLIVGGGAIGCEFACLFHELGSRVVLLEKTPALLPGEDAALVQVLQTSFEQRGIQIKTASTVDHLERKDGVWRCRLGGGETMEVDEVLLCVGRRPMLTGLGFENAGLRPENGRLPVNEFLQTSRPHIYAVGDVNGHSLLAHAAAAQGETAADHAAGVQTDPYDPLQVPRCLYTWPEAASVGEWRHTAETKGFVVKAHRFFFQGSPKAWASDEATGFLQLISDKNTGRILGAQIVGPHATELIHLVSVALRAKLTTDQLRSVVFAHPTLSESLRGALSRG